ncbi:hypothetical protein Taro_010205 [Colocasia esculenta]|uniref:protein-serine/threonine phosphatase n=1 Tax=Colocasia esculenta TaxID=4460 RepID=A0A843U7R1_COLES|nr:hypothetical protein [Colocasia esculenta]
MSRPMLKSPVWHGDSFLGEAEVFPTKNHQRFQFPNNEIRIAKFSPRSERCSPLSILHTISPFSILYKVQCLSATEKSPIYLLYLSCFQELKTAIVVSGGEELHLVAMPTKVDRPPCFWCFSVPAGLYDSCLGMLNLRCLAIVFDLDETLIVANTMKSFEDRIEVLTRRIVSEDDPVRVSGMSAELKRYLEDKALLKQYAENDNVLDNGKLIGVQNEEVPPPTVGGETIVRPIIRLRDKNIVLTRINPEIRDTSVLVRLRPAWEDLRSYLTAKGRKRFEVYVCTMAERDYALEMWRLLDPGAHLISSKELLNRVVCVKSGLRKSLLNVFQKANCHPRMAMVIDDRLKVWDDRDQPRVHVVPAFTPYYAPQAETANAVPVLCVARNVACNVRGGFFKEFDENLLRKTFELYYENDIVDLPFTPDVSDYMMTEDSAVMPNGNREAPIPEGMSGAEVERKLNGSENVGDECKLQPQAQSSNASVSDDEISINRAPSGNKDFLLSTLSVGVLTEIGRRCESKVEFKPVTASSKDLQISVEVFFSGEKIGAGVGRTWKEAQHQAADNALRHLAKNYVTFMTLGMGAVDRDLDKLSLHNENGFLREFVDTGSNELPKKEDMPNATMTEPSNLADDSRNLSAIIAEVKELCSGEGFGVVFQDQPPTSMTLKQGEFYAQVEIAGQVLGKGIGLSKEGAKLQAAEEALRSLKAPENQQAQKHPNLSRPSVAVPTKRFKDEASWGFNGSPSARLHKNGN